MGSGARGFTLIELVVVLTLVGLLSMLALPSFSNMLERKRLQAATEALVSDLRRARSESAKRDVDMQVTFRVNDDCYGLTENVAAGCNCTVADDCAVEGVDTARTVSDHKGVQLTKASFAGGAGVPYVTWNYLRSTANAGSACLQTTGEGYRTRVRVSTLGRITICSPAAGVIMNYPACTGAAFCP